MRQPRPELGCCATGKEKEEYADMVFFCGVAIELLMLHID
jgi:hypothetical protein